MKRGAVAGLALTFVAVTAIVAPRVQARGGLGGVPSAKGAYCSGLYADDFAALSPAAREAEQKPQSQSWVYAIRTTATYECLSYAGDGNVRRVRRKALAHGTGFGYRQQSGETYILTNHHVAEWPPVTDDEHKVDDVPPGCKKVSDALRIVESERDTYDRDDIPLQRVVTDKSMDMAVPRRTRSFPPPLEGGAFGGPQGAQRGRRARLPPRGVQGDQRRGSRVDLRPRRREGLGPRRLRGGRAAVAGQLGVTVLGVSCRTGEFELVGVYHAGYAGNTPLNVVVAIIRRDYDDAEEEPAAGPHRGVQPRPQGADAALLGAGRRDSTCSSPSTGRWRWPAPE